MTVELGRFLIGNEMKWTKTEEIEFDLENLPNEVYGQMAEALLGDLVAWFWHDGTFGFTHEWSNDLTHKTWSLETLAKEAVDQGLENDQMKMMLVELEKAATVLRTAIAPNA